MEKYNVKQSSRSRATRALFKGYFRALRFSVRAGNPNFFSQASGSGFWDIDRNEYIDMMCTYGPVLDLTIESMRQPTNNMKGVIP